MSDVGVCPFFGVTFLNSGGPTGCGSSARLKTNTRKRVTRKQVRRQPRGTHLNQNLPQMQTEGRRVLRTPTAKEPYHLLSSAGDLP